MSAVDLTNAEAIHPGYGFLSENANFAKILEDNNIKFIGASSRHIEMMGDKIKKGQTIMIVEAMKTMNHVPSTSDGTVKKILVNDGQPVEFGQPLIVLK